MDNNLHTILITLKGKNNITYTGTLVLSNVFQTNLTRMGHKNVTVENEKAYNQQGASYYAVAVVLVYGISIVMLIASHIKRRHEKILEDKQIEQYLQDFQIVKEEQARESYKHLKKSIAEKIKWDQSKTYHNLQQSILPLMLVAMPGAGSSTVLNRISSIESVSSNSSQSTMFPNFTCTTRDKKGGHIRKGKEPSIRHTNNLQLEYAYHAPVHYPHKECFSLHELDSLHGSHLLSNISEQDESSDSLQETVSTDFSSQHRTITVYVDTHCEDPKTHIILPDSTAGSCTAKTESTAIQKQEDDTSISVAVGHQIYKGERKSMHPSIGIVMQDTSLDSETSGSSDTGKVSHVTYV